MRRRKPCPDVGAYRKIDVYARPVNASALVYLHSTEAYPTIRQAISGAILAFERSDAPGGRRRYTMTVYDSAGGGFARLDFDPYSVVAEYAKKGA